MILLLIVLIFILGFISNRTELHIRPTVVSNPILFNLGKLISYGITGVILGLLGFMVKINGFNGGIFIFIFAFISLIITFSHIPIFPKIRLLGHRNQRNIENSFLLGGLNIFVSSASLHSIMILALAHGYFLESGYFLISYALGTLYIPGDRQIKFKKILKTTKFILLFLSTIFVVNKGLLYTESYLFSPFEYTKTVTIPESLNNIQFLRTTTKDFGNRILMSKDQPLNWMIEGIKKSDKIYIPKFRHKSELGIGTQTLDIKTEKSGFIYFTGNLGHGDYIIKVVDGVIDAYNLPYKVVLDSGYEYGIHEAETVIPDIALTDELVLPTYSDNSQTVNIDLTAEGFKPNIIILKRGVPAILDFNVLELTEENKRIILPSYNEYLEFILGHNPINVTDPLIDFIFFSWKGSLGGYILVVEDPDEITLEIAKRQIRMFNVNGI